MSIATPNGFQLDNSGKRVVVDPITRIEGHLRIEVNVDENNVIRNAVSTGTMWRGLEVILRGRDPRDAWAFVQRICGVCTGVHALASVRCVEDALKIEIPENANTIRNIMHLTLYSQDHLVHFYHLHALDWVDVVSALSADPNATSQLAQSISPWPMSSPGYFRDLQNRLKKFVESGQLGPFRNGYWGHPAYKLPPEANLMAVAHYLEALDFQKEIVKIQTIFGGRNPHPNWLVGGVPSPINLNDTGAVGAINMERLNMVGQIIDRTIEFIDQVYIPDLLAIASFYKDWASIGGGLSSKYLLSYGDLPKSANDYAPDNLMLPRGAIIDGNLNEVQDVDLNKVDEIQEFVDHSWYKYEAGATGLHPYEGETVPNFDIGGAKGTKTNIENVDEASKYSWVKSPRWKGHAMEVGPLARFVIGYVKGQRRHQGAGGQGARQARRAGDGAVLDARPHGGPRPRVPLGGPQAEGRVPQADRQHQGRRHCHREHGQLRPEHVAEGVAGASASSRPRAARWRTGSTSRTGRSRTTSASCPPPGTPARVTQPARSAPTRPRCSTRR